MKIRIGIWVTEWPCTEAVLNKFPISRHHFARSCIKRVNKKLYGSNVNMCEILRIHSCVKIVLKLFSSDNNNIKVEGSSRETTMKKIVQLFLDQERMEKRINVWKTPKIYASTNVYIHSFFSIYLHHLYLYFPPCLIPSPRCHWILKIWRHLDCSRRIIFRFQLIYHCRVRKGKTFSHAEIFVSKKKEFQKKEGGERKSHVKTHKLRLTHKTFDSF